MVIVVIENAARLSIPFLVKVGIDSGIPPISEDDNLEPLLLIVGAVLVATITQAVTRNVFLVRSGTIGQERPVPDPAAGVPAVPAPQPRLPRQLHLGSGDLPPDLRRRRPLRDARVRLRRAGDRPADVGRHGRPAAVPRRQARPGGPALRAVPRLADQLVPQGVGQELPRHPREGRARHRPLRRVDGRDPRRPGVPSRAPQPGDLRRRQRAVPRRQPGRLPAGRLVHARHPADRQRHHRRGAGLRRLPGLPRRGHRRRAGGLPALPAPVLRADAGDLAVLQHLPVGLGRAGEALRRAGGEARRPRADEPRPAARPAGRPDLRPRRLRVRRGRAGAARTRPGRPGGPDAGAGRHDRCRQDHAGQAGHPLLRPRRWPGTARRRRPARPLRRATCTGPW